MKRSVAVTALLFSTVLLAGCGDAKDAKLSEMNDPEVAKELLEELTPQERQLLQAYIYKHAIKNDLDFKVTVEDAIEEQEEANEEAEKLQKQAAEAAAKIR